VKIRFTDTFLRKPALLPSSGEEAPNPVEDLDRATRIVSHWEPKTYSSYVPENRTYLLSSALSHCYCFCYAP